GEPGRTEVEPDLLAGTRVRHDRDEVALRARGDEEPGRLAEPLRSERLEAADGRVLAPDVVADLGARHGLAHLGRRLRERVGPQVNHVVSGHQPLSFSRLASEGGAPAPRRPATRTTVGPSAAA